MPRIPTFTTQARPTAEVGDIRSNIQISPSQNIATALEPVTKAIMKYAAVEKFNQSKTEALELENQAVLELSTISQEASKRKNKEEANSYLLNESKRIRDQFSAKASSSQVKSIFENSYLQEEQKQIYKVDGAVYKNMLQSYANNKETKRQRILSEGLWGNNKLAEETMNNSLMQLELDDTFQDDDTKEKNIADIPVKIDYFKAKKDIERDAGSAYSQLSNNKNYSNLTVDMRTELLRESKLMAAPGVRDQASNYLAGLEAGKEIPVNETNIKNILGPDYYTEFKEQQSGLKRIVSFTNAIYKSKIGEEDAVINSYEPREEAMEFDLRLKTKLEIAKKNKEVLIKEDPVSLFLNYDPIVQDKYNDYVSEQNPELKKEKNKIYINSMLTAQRDMGIDHSNIKLLGKKQAINIVSEVTDETKKWEEQKAILQGVSEAYGSENMPIIFNQLSEEKLPTYVQIAMTTNNDDLNKSILASAKTKDLEKLVKSKLKPGQSLDIVKKEISKELDDWEQVIQNQPDGTVNKEKYLLAVQETLYKAALYNINRNDDLSGSAKNVVDQFKSDYTIAPSRTFFVPKDVNKKPVAADIVINKSDMIQYAVEKSDYLERFHGKDPKNYAHYATMSGYQNALPDELKVSTPEVFNAAVKDAMLNAIKKNPKWLLNNTSTGLVLYFETSTGTVPVINSDGEKIEFYFTDQPNQNPKIKSIDLVEPVTNLPLIKNYIDPFDEIGTGVE
jgi:hypothetical protein